jgi:hypothetical protein
MREMSLPPPAETGLLGLGARITNRLWPRRTLVAANILAARLLSEWQSLRLELELARWV